MEPGSSCLLFMFWGHLSLSDLYNPWFPFGSEIHVRRVLGGYLVYLMCSEQPLAES